MCCHGTTGEWDRIISCSIFNIYSSTPRKNIWYSVLHITHITQEPASKYAEHINLVAVRAYLEHAPCVNIF